MYKMAWTSAMGFSLFSMTNSSDKTVPYLALVAGYPFLTLKTISQVGTDAGSFTANFSKDMALLRQYLNVEGLRSLYRGALPYAFLVGVAHWSFPQIWSSEKKDSHFKELQLEWVNKMKAKREMHSRNHGF